jgi:hypothetical protein
MARCPFCLEWIKDGAFLCKHCGREFLPEFLNFYRPILDEKPELRENNIEIRKQLDFEVKNAYLVFLTKLEIKRKEAKEQDEIQRQKNIDLAKKQEILRNQQRDKIKHYIKQYAPRVLIALSLLLIIYIAGISTTRVEFTISLENIKKNEQLLVSNNLSLEIRLVEYSNCQTYKWNLLRNFNQARFVNCGDVSIEITENSKASDTESKDPQIIQSKGLMKICPYTFNNIESVIFEPLIQDSVNNFYEIEFTCPILTKYFLFNSW